jgi:hypothetical protein
MEGEMSDKCPYCHGAYGCDAWVWNRRCLSSAASQMRNMTPEEFAAYSARAAQAVDLSREDRPCSWCHGKRMCEKWGSSCTPCMAQTWLPTYATGDAPQPSRWWKIKQLVFDLLGSLFGD